MNLKIYVTDWIPELGRYAIITTALKVPKSNSYAAEAFVFALDGPTYFCGKRLNYNVSASAKELIHVDEMYMLKEALSQAKEIITLEKFRVYQKTLNINVLRPEKELSECPDIRLILLSNIRARYEDMLRELSEESWSKELKSLLKMLFGVTVTIEPFK